MAEKHKSTESFYSYSAKRKLRKEEVAAYRRIGLATVLVVGLLVAGYFIGVPLIARMGGDDVDPASLNKLGTKDTIPPSTPRLDSLPEAVRSAAMTVKGTAESSATVTLFIDEKKMASVVVDRDGHFEGDLELQNGLNTITAVATDPAGNSSRPSQAVAVLLKTTPPQLRLTEEIPGQTDRSLLTVKGKTEAGASVTINDRAVILADDNSFETDVSLKEGENTIKIVATDRAGNTRQISRTVTLEKNPESSASAELKD